MGLVNHRRERNLAVGGLVLTAARLVRIRSRARRGDHLRTIARSIAETPLAVDTERDLLCLRRLRVPEVDAFGCEREEFGDVIQPRVGMPARDRIVGDAFQRADRDSETVVAHLQLVVVETRDR